MPGYAVRMTAPGRAELEPRLDLEPLPPDQIEGVAVASAISPGTEIEGTFAKPDPSHFPRGSGYAMVFRVTHAKEDSGFAPGDLAFTMKAHATPVRCLPTQAWRLPQSIDPFAATLARLAGVSWSTLTTTLARPPAKAVVTGLGIVGNLAAQILHASGYQVMGCDPVDDRRSKLERLGMATCAKLPISDAAWCGQTELVVDCSGHEAAVLDACKIVRKGGEVVLVGVPWRKRTDLAAFDVLDVVFHNYVHLRGGWEWQVPLEPSDFRRGSVRSNIAAALDWIAAGRIQTEGLYRLADPRECETVYQQLQERGPGPLTAIFDWSRVEGNA